MKCEYFDGCSVYQNAGEAACRRHFCNDTCPTPKEAKSANVSAEASAKAKVLAEEERDNADHGPGRMEQSGDSAGSGNQPVNASGSSKPKAEDGKVSERMYDGRSYLPGEDS